MRKLLIRIAGVLAVVIVVVGIFVGPMLVKMMTITRVDVDSNLKVFLGGGGNSIVLKSDDNQQILIVDTKMGRAAKKLKQYVDSLNPAAKVTIINTHFHPDHTGGNALYPHAVVITGGSLEDLGKKDAAGLDREIILPVMGKMLTVGNEVVQIRNLGQAHSLNDTVVYLVRHKMLITGDLLFNEWNPVLKKETTDVGKWVEVLNYMLDTFDAQVVVPGHGNLTDRKGLLAMREYFSSISLALDDPRKIDSLRERYKDYASLPGMSGFDHTLKFIQEEKKKTAK
jgi:glyoxylase-like metal-dependent hydrolase (beta-lactamase superfamily II)